MFVIIGLMLTGVLLGYTLKRKNVQWINRLITLFIWLLLFILGMEVGSNRQIIGNLHSLGGEALLLAVGGTLGSVLAAWGLWHWLYGKRGGAG